VGEMDKEFNYSKLFDLKQETLGGHSLNMVRARYVSGQSNVCVEQT